MFYLYISVIKWLFVLINSHKHDWSEVNLDWFLYNCILKELFLSVIILHHMNKLSESDTELNYVVPE